MKFFCLFLLVLAGCQKYGLVLHQQRVDASYLASTNIGSPDPRQKCPPSGQLLIVEWWVPSWVVRADSYVRLHLVFRNHTEEFVEFPINRRLGYETYELYSDDLAEKGGFMTFKAEIITGDGEVFREWKHQMWVNLIQMDEEMSADSTVEKSIHGSVIETPLCKPLALTG